MKKLMGEKAYLQAFSDMHLNHSDYLVWLRDYDVIKTLNLLDYLRPISFKEVQIYCQALMSSKQDMFFAIHDNQSQQFIGTLRVARINWQTRTADIGIMLGAREFWGQGIATDTIRTVCTYLFNQYGLRKLTAGLMSVNQAMQKVFTKLGFEVEGVFRQQDYFEGEYIDHIYLGCFKHEFTG